MSARENILARIGKAAKDWYEKFVDGGNGNLDFSAVIKSVGKS